MRNCVQALGWARGTLEHDRHYPESSEHVEGRGISFGGEFASKVSHLVGLLLCFDKSLAEFEGAVCGWWWKYGFHQQDFHRWMDCGQKDEILLNFLLVKSLFFNTLLTEFSRKITGWSRELSPHRSWTWIWIQSCEFRISWTAYEPEYPD